MKTTSSNGVFLFSMSDVAGDPSATPGCGGDEFVHDLLRQEGVSQLVAQAINSHHDPKMHAHSSTISDAEKTGALAKVIRLFPAPPETTTLEATTRPPTPSGVADRVADPASENAPPI